MLTGLNRDDANRYVERCIYVNLSGYSVPDFIQTVAMKTGIILDPTYTGKAVRGLLQEIQAHPDQFQGKRILFIHTGKATPN